MSKIKEAKEAIETLRWNIEYAEGRFFKDDGSAADDEFRRSLDAMKEALALLHPLSEEPLQGLRDDVQAVLKKLPHARCHNLEIPEGCGGQCQGADEECAKCLLQSALIKHRAEEPEAGEFTKKWRDNVEFWGLDKFDGKRANMAVQGLLEACIIIDNQAQTIKDQAAEIKDVIKLKDGIIKALNKRLSDLGAQC